jgi:hypothetical protein
MQITCKIQDVAFATCGGYVKPPVFMGELVLIIPASLEDRCRPHADEDKAAMYATLWGR